MVCYRQENSVGHILKILFKMLPCKFPTSWCIEKKVFSTHDTWHDDLANLTTVFGMMALDLTAMSLNAKFTPVPHRWIVIVVSAFIFVKNSFPKIVILFLHVADCFSFSHLLVLFYFVIQGYSIFSSGLLSVFVAADMARDASFGHLKMVLTQVNCCSFSLLLQGEKSGSSGSYCFPFLFHRLIFCHHTG